MEKEQKFEFLPQYLAEERNKSMVQIRGRGFTFGDIALIFRVSRSLVHAICKATDEEIKAEK